jgi:hypothetical protein
MPFLAFTRHYRPQYQKEEAGRVSTSPLKNHGAF